MNLSYLASCLYQIHSSQAATQQLIAGAFGLRRQSVGVALREIESMRYIRNLGYSSLPPTDPLYGRWYAPTRRAPGALYGDLFDHRVRSSIPVMDEETAAPLQCVRFPGGKIVRTHELWIAWLYYRLSAMPAVAVQSETYLRKVAGWTWHKDDLRARKCAWIPDLRVGVSGDRGQVVYNLEVECSRKSTAYYEKALEHTDSQTPVIYACNSSKLAEHLADQIRLLPLRPGGVRVRRIEEIPQLIASL